MLGNLGRCDRVLVPHPSYPYHIYGAIIAGADIRSVRMTPGVDFFPEAERAIRELIPKPMMRVLGSPSNPTAMCVDLEFFKRIVALAKRHDITLVHDLAYADIIDTSTRMRPDLIICGELSVHNAVPMVRLLHTGHDGMMMTRHAN